MSKDLKFIETPYGIKIATYIIGNKGPFIILSNGLGGNIVAWRHLTEYFKDRFRIVSWDYRGLYNSSKPEDDVAYTIFHHCDDLEAVISGLEINKAIFLGWSMGVQLNLEYYKRRPEKFLCMVHINGTYGHPFISAFNSRISSKIVPLFIDIIEKVFPKIQFLAPFITNTRTLIDVAKITGFVSNTLDEDIFFELAKDWVKLDFVAYAKSLRYLGEHNAKDILKKIKVPTLIIAGERDLFTPVEVSREMNRAIRNSELFIVKGATHYVPVEFPEILNLRIEKFLRENSLLLPI